MNILFKKVALIVFVWMLILSKMSTGQTFIGHFEYKSSELLGGGMIDFYKDGSYRYVFSGERYFMSVGYWKQKKQVLYLTDSLENGFKVQVEERYNKNRNEIYFGSAVYMNGDTEHHAEIIVNSDSSTACYFTYGICKYPMHTVKNFRILVDGMFSYEYRVKSSQTNEFGIVIKAPPLSAYQILKAMKFYIKGRDTLILFDEQVKSKRSNIFKRIDLK